MNRMSSMNRQRDQEVRTAQERLAAAVAAARPDHTTATLTAQSARISHWVRLWLRDRYYRRAILDKAAGRTLEIRIPPAVRDLEVS